MLDTTDLIILILVTLGTLAYFTKGKLWAKPAQLGYGYGAGAKTATANGIAKPKKTRNIVERMEQQNKNVVVFFGSQTGTAEDYSSRLAKEGHSRYGLNTMIADLEEFDYDNLDNFPSDKLAIFVLATYGEGEPTDNAVDFYEFINGDDVSFSGEGEGDPDKPLSSLKYVAFGLGNKTYEHYNAMVRRVDAALTKQGATRIGAAGEGDDGEGTMEEDFLAWKEGMWEAVAREMHLEEREAVYEPVFEIQEQLDLSPEDATVYLGEPSKQHLTGTKGPYSSHNPYVAPIVASREIFTTPERNCLHMEVSLEGSGLSYQTGDHLAVWPTNADREVDRLLRILGIESKRSTVLKISSTDPTTKIPVPTPTTYEAILRYYLEICAPVSRQSLPTLAQFAPSEQAKAEMLRIGNDKDAFQDSVARYCLNIAQVMEAVSGGSPWSTVPFSFILETFNHIVPRYYSISSSSKLYPTTPHITAVVEARSNGDGREVLYGVTTNYLLALKSKQHGEANPHPHGISYAIEGPRNKYDGIHVPAHTRHSNFKLPSDPRKPIIMVGPGTGVAPFRGFVQERAKALEDGAEIGKMLLFFGCRKRDEDFLYRDEWEEFESKLGDKFEMVKAFSREQKHKVYVQNKMQDYGKEINKLLEEGAYFYICGDAANMARAVNSVLGEIIEQERGLKLGGGDEVVKMLRASNMYLEDVWS